MDCEFITATVRGHCGVCGSRSLMSVARPLGGVIEGQERARLLVDDAAMEAVVRELVESAA